MLRLWIGYPPKGYFKEKLVRNPDYFFSDYFLDTSFVATDFGRRVVCACSDVKEVLSCVTLRVSSGRLISPMQLSSGAKNIFIMKETSAICNMGWCGGNCEPFVDEISHSQDLTLYTDRFYVPYLYTNDERPFEVLNLGRVFESASEYLDDMEVSMLLDKLEEVSV